MPKAKVELDEDGLSLTRVERLNRIYSKVPRRSTAVLGRRDKVKGVTVLSRVGEIAVVRRPATRDREADCVMHRTVKVLVDGESKPRRIEYSRLAEFARRQESSDGDD